MALNIDEIVKSHLADRDYIYGYADLRGLLAYRYSEFGFGIAVGCRLDNEIIDSIAMGPNKRYHQLYSAVNNELKEVAGAIAKDLRANGVKALATVPTLTEADRDERFDRSLKLDFSHKLAATRGGLGWIGKSDLLVTYEFGPRVRLVSVLIDAPVDYCRKPALRGECGSCNQCVLKCPAQALSGKEWDVGVRREEIFDAFLCREKCRELGELHVARGVRLCGVCISVCPKGR